MEENQSGQYWDGRQFVTNPNTPKDNVSLFLRLTTKSQEYDEANCHFDGVFKCPRCWRTHNIIGNYDLLCDGCVNIELKNNNANTISNINRWMDMQKKHWSGDVVAEILVRSFARDILNARKDDEYRAKSIKYKLTEM